MNYLKRICGAAILSGILATPIVGLAADHDHKTEGKPGKKAYPLKTCVVSGEKLGSMGDPYVHQYKGQEVQFCCKGCLTDFNKEPAKYIKKLDEAKSKQTGLKPYPLATCVVSDEKLGEMGEPYVHAYKDREVKLCCEGCVKDFNKEPAKYLKKLEAAEKQAKAKN